MSVNHTVENVYIRQYAIFLTRQYFWRLLGMLLLSALIAYGLPEVLTAGCMQLLQPEIEAARAGLTAISSQVRMEAMLNAFLSPKFLLLLLTTSLLTGLVEKGVSLGHTVQLLRAARGEKPRIMGIFSRMKYCLRALLLMLWIVLKTVLWLLPGIVLVIIGMGMQASVSFEFCNLVMVLGVYVMIGLGIPAAYRYSLAEYILAEEPSTGVRACVAQSKQMMAGRKWQFFKLGVPCFFKSMGVIIGLGFIGGFVLIILGLDENARALELMGEVIVLPAYYFLMQYSLACALFYMQRREPEAEKPVSHEPCKEAPYEGDALPVSAWQPESAETEAPAESPEASEPADEPAPESDPEVDA